MDLAKKHCVPCEDKDFPPLSRVQAEEDFLPHVPGWALNADATEIGREFTFKNFKEAMAFANSIADLAEEEGHHPDLSIGWGRVGVRLSTHSIKGLSENDFILAARINQIG